MLDIINLVKSGRLTEASEKLKGELDTRRDALLDVGRQNLAESILPHKE